jgi:hypothetical protein
MPTTADRRWHIRRRLQGIVMSRDFIYQITPAGLIRVLGRREEVLQ